MGSFGILEIILLLVVGILVFGGELPEVGRKLGRIWGRIRHYINQFQEDIEQETATVQERIELEEATEDSFYSRQSSPETKPPEAYREEDGQDQGLEDDEHDDDGETSQRYLADEIEQLEAEDKEQSSTDETDEA